MKRKYYSLEKVGSEANINIYGDITSYPYFESDVSASNLSKQLGEMKDVSKINVFINSYGGEVAEGLAIYNALKRHEAKVVTYCDGFAASIASVIFMAGDERVMNEASLLMIHNAWTCATGNAEELRKQADDLEKITQSSVGVYKAHSSLSEEEIKVLMDKESWISPTEAIEYGFATAIEAFDNKNASQNAFKKLFDVIMAYQAEEETDDEEATDEETTDEETDDTSTEDGTEDTAVTDDETTEETDDGTSEDETEDDESDDETETTTQKWSGFFNALLKM